MVHEFLLRFACIFALTARPLCRVHTTHNCTGRQTGRQADRQTDRQTDRQVGRQAGRQTGRQAGRQTDRQAGRQAGRQTSRQAGRQGFKAFYSFSFLCTDTQICIHTVRHTNRDKYMQSKNSLKKRK